MNVIAPLTTNKTTVSYSRASIASTRDRAGSFVIVPANELRFNYYLDSTNTNIDYFSGVLIEPKRTNYLKNTATSLVPGSGSPSIVPTQTVVISPTPPDAQHLTLSFFGNGTVTVEGGGFTYSLTGTANATSVSPSYMTFPLRASSLLVTVTGQVYAANLEGANSIGLGAETDVNILTARTRPTSWIPTTGTIATREADVVSDSGILFNEFIEDTLAYDSSTPYNTGDRVKFNDKIWQSITDSNLSNEPAESSINWSKVQTVNNLAMLDLEEGSVSTATQGVQGTRFVYIKKATGEVLTAPSSALLPYFRDACAVDVGAQVSEVTVLLSTSLGVFSKTSVKKSSETTNLVMGLFDELSVIFDSPSTNITIYHAAVSLRLHNGMDAGGDMLYPSSEVSIGELVFGTSIEFGGTNYGVRTGILDYSRKEENDFGVVSFVQRGYRKTVTATVGIKNEDFNNVVQILYALRAKPAVWITTDVSTYLNAAVVYGTYKDFNIVISYPSYSLLDIEIQGLVI